MFTLSEELKFWIDPEIHPFCGPLFFARSLDSPASNNIVANGSYGLVDTGAVKLLVTCQHVWKEFNDRRRIDPKLRLLVCLTPENPILFDSNEPLDQDEHLDIATFDIEPFLPACLNRKFYPLSRNPSRRLAKGDKLVLLGYPGRFRIDLTNTIEFGRILYAVTVSDVSGLKFVADISKVKNEFKHAPKKADQLHLHGGISGSPCFLLRPNNPAQLVGFTNSQNLGLLHFSHTRCIRSDGKIDREVD